MAAATLQSLHPDRDVLVGVGISSPTVVARWHGAPYGDRPLARVREYLTVLRSASRARRSPSTATSTSSTASASACGSGSAGPRLVLGAAEPRHAPPRRRARRRRAAQLPARRATCPGPSSGSATGGDATVYAYVHVGVTDREPHLDAGPPRPVLLRRGRLLRRQLRAGGLRRGGRRDPGAPRRRRPRRGRGRGLGPHGRRHRRAGRRRPRPRRPCGPTPPPASRCPSSCPCRGARTAWPWCAATMEAAASWPP